MNRQNQLGFHSEKSVKSLFDGTLKKQKNHRLETIKQIENTALKNKNVDKRYDIYIDPLRNYFKREKLVNQNIFSRAVKYVQANPKLKLDKARYEIVRKSKSENAQENIYIILILILKGTITFPNV